MQNGLIVALIVAAAVGLLLWARSRGGQVVYPWEEGLLYEDGVFKRALGPGRYSLWSWGRRRHIQTVPRHAQYSTSGPTDVITSDRFPLRLSATVIYLVSDSRAAVEEQLAERIVHLTREALIAISAERTLEALLAERANLGAALTERLEPALKIAKVELAMISGLTLPPEIRRLVIEVERAKLEGLAALERARGEHASLRALANAARLMKDNPELANLRALQAMAEVKNATLVLGHAPGSSVGQGLPPAS
jgi:regulator of protease activity HflC (stomatin/prohibitin superfamily)